MDVPEIICRQSKRSKNFGKGEEATITENDNLAGVIFQFGLDEAQQVLLIHACRMVDMCINFPYVVEIAMWNRFLRHDFTISIE